MSLFRVFLSILCPPFAVIDKGCGSILIVFIPIFFTLTSLVGTQILKHNDISYLTILDTVFDIVLTFLIAYLFFKEKVTTKKIIGILLVLSGILLVH